MTNFSEATRNSNVINQVRTVIGVWFFVFHIRKRTDKRNRVTFVVLKQNYSNFIRDVRAFLMRDTLLVPFHFVMAFVICYIGRCYGESVV